MFNEGKNITKLSEILKVDNSTIRNYLKTASECGLCYYDPINEFKRSHQEFIYRNTQNKSKPIICVQNGFVFSSSLKCQNESLNVLGIKLDSRNIRLVLHHKRNYTWHFTFSYITCEQFNNIKSISPEFAFGDFFI